MPFYIFYPVQYQEIFRWDLFLIRKIRGEISGFPPIFFLRTIGKEKRILFVFTAFASIGSMALGSHDCRFTPIRAHWDLLQWNRIRTCEPTWAQLRLTRLRYPRFPMKCNPHIDTKAAREGRLTVSIVLQAAETH